ncbi:uncharacterized protein LOC126413127 [Schistocerca serialis cubense]|uniref:uncharacterized protein LOC126413127 n=1 Tax=Schistocerca serialis cubense TaxID=2023355 RepID=UPI00214E9032|nr:uncharacterized protein LOC126413127 [Schistocerca serialis cubense]
MSTYFPRKDIHKITWKSPDQETQNQADHILVDAIHRSAIQIVKSQRGAEIRSDHYLVVTIIEERIESRNSRRKEAEQKINADLLKEDHIEERCASEIGNMFASIEKEDEDNIEKFWPKIKTCLKDAASEVLKPMEKRRKSRGWFNDRCRDAGTKRKAAKLLWLTNEQDERTRLGYMEAAREARQVLRTEKREFINSKIKLAEEDQTVGSTRDFYRTVWFFKKEYNTRSDVIRGQEGQIITDEMKAMEEWKNLLENLLNVYVNTMSATTENEEGESYKENRDTVPLGEYEPPSVEEDYPSKFSNICKHHLSQPEVDPSSPTLSNTFFATEKVDVNHQ